MPSLPKGCPVTLALIVINVLLYVGQQATNDLLTNQGLLYGPAVEGGQYWRIVSSGFLHGNIVHIGFNVLLLYMLGPYMEQGLGSLRFSLIYFGSLFGGALAVLLFGFTQPTLGASGAILGLAGAMFMIFWSRGASLRESPGLGLVVLNLASPLLIRGISFWGHFGGVVAGAALAFVLVTLPEKSQTPGSKKSLSQGSALVVLMALACVVVPQLG